ncbi:MAG: aquaporin [Vulcanimicrobiaceae bacterium]
MLGAECLGTFLLTFVGAGADVIDAVSSASIGHVGRYLAPGLVVTGMIYSLSAISGAHINPAVTIAFALRGTFPPGRVMPYIVAQCTGAVGAALLLRAFFGAAIAHGVTRSALGGAQSIVAWEAALTLLLVFVILSTTEEKATVGKNAAIAVGFTVAACGLFSSPMTGASMNPARSFGPAVVAGDVRSLWAYAAGPVAGAALAVVLVRLLHGSAPMKDRAGAGEEAT